jgi:hypothetical protein
MIFMVGRGILRRRVFWELLFFLVGVVLLILSIWPFNVVPPQEPFEVGAGPCPPSALDHTEVYLYLRANAIRVSVFFNSCSTSQLYAYVLLPFTSDNVSASLESSATGSVPINVSSSNFFQYGVCVANATYTANETKDFSDPQISLVFSLSSSLIQSDFLGATHATIVTFFGPRGAMGWPSEVFNYEGQNLTWGISRPIFVHANLPRNTYLSTETFPTPIQYYTREDQTWIMFNPIFRDNNYAQTVLCYFTEPSREQMRQFLIFAAGAFVAISGSLIANWAEEKMKSGRTKSKDGDIEEEALSAKPMA